MVRKGKSNGDNKPVKKPRRVAAPRVTRQPKTSRKPAVTRKPASDKKHAVISRSEVVRAKTHLTPKELAHFQSLLLEKRAELIGDVNSMEDEALQKSKLSASGDLSTMPIHMADIGTANYEQEFALGLLDGERKLLREIKDALQRIEDRTYGVCEGTGREIPKARLEANPWARYCVEYARMVEQGLVREGEEHLNEEDEQEDILDEEDILDDEGLVDDTDEVDETPEEEPTLEDEEESGDDDTDWRESKD